MTRLALAAALIAGLGACVGPTDRTSPCACDWERITPAAPAASMDDLA